MKQFYLIFTLLCCVSRSFAQTLEDDRLALKAIYDKMNGSSWIVRFGIPWQFPGAPGDNPCGWNGIDCENGRVTGLSLVSVYLQGIIPPEIGNLTALKSLGLSSAGPDAENPMQGVGGPIPNEIGNLINLEVLNLRSNEFSGSIPASIGNLVKLKYLNIGYVYFPNPFQPFGKLSGPIPPELGNLVNLEYLNLEKQNLSGNIPAVLGNLVKLKELDLSDNNFSGSIPSSFGNLTKLTYLDLSYVHDPVRTNEWTQLGGTIPDLSGIPVSAFVNISGNSFTFAGMESNISRLDNYSNQAKFSLEVAIPLSEVSGPGGVLLAYKSGGIRANNTYKWYKDGQLVANAVGLDNYSGFTLGTYRVEVTNSLIPGLTLVSENYIVDELSPFPVKLLSFSGVHKETENLLTWKTTSETNNKGFQIERSADAKTFENIGFVDGLGDNRGEKTYTFLDAKPYFKTYYRLKQLDWDGKSEYSRIITVKQDKTKLSVYPNPAKNEFFVSGLDREEAVEIRNAMGRVVLEQKVNPAEPVPTSQLANGIYLIKIGEETRKLVIQN